MKYRPVYTITPRLLSEVEQVAALHERISAAAVQVAWIPALQKDTRVRNAHSSTAIEGNPLTLEQVRAIEEGREVPATGPRSQREVTNYFAGLRFVEKNAQRSAMTHAEVLKLHRIMAGAVMDQELPDVTGRFGCEWKPMSRRHPRKCTDDVGVTRLVERPGNKNFADSELGYYSSSFRNDSSLRGREWAHGADAGVVGTVPAPL
jgi:hypothetical protein